MSRQYNATDPTQAQWSALPTALPGGDLMPHMSAKFRTATMDALFIGSGGFDRALAWVEESSDNYGEFFKLWAKGAAHHRNVEVSADDSVEAMLARLDAGEHAKVIESTPTGTHNPAFYEDDDDAQDSE